MKVFLRFSLPGLILTALAFPLQANADAFSDMGVIRPKASLPAPNFVLDDLQGGRQQLSQLKGKVVLLHFWATWCIPCRTEMPALHKMWHSFRKRGLEVVCVNVDRGNRQGVETFMQDINLHFHTLLDPEGEARRQYEIFALPTSYIIGRDGKIIGRVVGERDWDSTKSRALVEYLLAPSGKAVKKPVQQVESDT